MDNMQTELQTKMLSLSQLSRTEITKDIFFRDFLL